MNKTFLLTRGLIAESVDADEKSLGESLMFDRGTPLTISRIAHPWGTLDGVEYCTVIIGGRYFNIPVRVLASSILPKRS